MLVAHYRLEVRLATCLGNEKGSVENAVGFLRRNLMVPPMRAESYGQLSRLLLERCDGLAKGPACPRLLDVPVAEVFDEERAALMPLPSTAFDPVRWESRTADKYGLVDIDSNRYFAGPDSARSRVLAASGTRSRPPPRPPPATSSRNIPDSTDGRAMWRIPRSCFPARGQTSRVAGKLDPPGRARRYTRVA